MADVSVVVPTHNRRHLLMETVGSVRRQRGVDVEVVVVDDGSSDGTAEALAQLRDRRIRVLHHPSPRGVAAARNTGIAAATGAWIALLDDDDLWAPDKLACQLAAANAAGRVWVYAGAVEIDPTGRLLGGLPPDPPERLIAQLPHRNPMPAGSSNVVAASDVLQRLGGFDEGLRHMADWDLWLRLADQHLPAVVSDPLVAYRMHPQQATLDTAGMVEEAHVLERRHGIDTATVHRWAAWACLRQGHRRLAARSYANAVRAGDTTSLARLAVALLHPRPTAARRRSALQPTVWATAANAWLAELQDKEDPLQDPDGELRSSGRRPPGKKP